jgi:hypothetical protein
MEEKSQKKKKNEKKGRYFLKLAFVKLAGVVPIEMGVRVGGGRAT